MKKMLITANIHAGNGAIREHLVDWIDHYVARGYEVSVHTSQQPRDLISYISQNAAGYDLLVSSGGDGTLNETLNGLMHCPSPPLLAYIPAGTVNDFATSLRIPRDLEQASRLVWEGVPFRCDIGRFGSQYFSYVAAFGAFTDVAYQTPQVAKQVLGRLAYLIEGIKRLPNLRAFPMKIQGDQFQLEDDFLFGMVSNSTSVGGFHFEDKLGVAMDDGVLEVLLVRMPHNMSEQQAVINGLMKQHPIPGLLYMFRTKQLAIRSGEAIPWTLDGEYGGTVQDVEIANCHQALNILVPKPEIQQKT